MSEGVGQKGSNNMIELGKKQTLKVVRIKDFGVYLGDEDKDHGVLLPKKQVPEGIKIGDELEVFVYKDSSDRLISTTKSPTLEVGQLAVLKVAEIGKIGAFLEWGLEKDLFLPFKEQIEPVKKGKEYLVALYIDKSERLCATMRVYDYLSNMSPYKEEDHVEGIIYGINPEIGAFVAVDNQYYGLIPIKDLYANYQIGDIVKARVVRVREDGKLDLSVREKAYMQMDADAELVLNVIDEFGGALPFGEKASPEVIKRELKLSKNAFKRALGRLLKMGKIEISENSIRKL